MYILILTKENYLFVTGNCGNNEHILSPSLRDKNRDDVYPVSIRGTLEVLYTKSTFLLRNIDFLTQKISFLLEFYR